MNDRESLLLRIAFLLRHLNEMAQRIDPEHPEVDRLREELEGVRSQWRAAMQELRTLETSR